jgi:hypothetical protein
MLSYTKHVGAGLLYVGSKPTGAVRRGRQASAKNMNRGAGDWVQAFRSCNRAHYHRAGRSNSYGIELGRAGAERNVN